MLGIMSRLRSLFNLKAFKRPSPEELIDAAERGNLNTAKILRIRGVDIDGTNKNGETALMRAAARGQSEFVDWLISHLATVDIKDNHGMTAEDKAKKTLNMNIARRLHNVLNYPSMIMSGLSFYTVHENVGGRIGGKII